MASARKAYKALQKLRKTGFPVEETRQRLGPIVTSKTLPGSDGNRLVLHYFDNDPTLFVVLERTVSWTFVRERFPDYGQSTATEFLRKLGPAINLEIEGADYTRVDGTVDHEAFYRKHPNAVLNLE